MKIIIDDKIPYIKGALEPFAEVVYLSGDRTTPEIVKDADALITRTRTNCNAQLLSGSSVKFIATATIGFDHIDTEYCDQSGITWTNAPGCNSKSVEQYIASALVVLADKKGFQLKDKTIGIIGVGNVGAKVARLCEILGMKVLLNDPPRARAEGKKAFVELDELLEKALTVSHVKDFLDKLPEGVDTLIGEKGVKLSGGERQRLGIARAIFKQPQILLLDEATSHLDLESEEKIKDSLHLFFENITALVIAHRLTTIREMDKIIVIEKGVILEQGSFDELYKKKGRFYELWEKQKFD